MNLFILRAARIDEIDRITRSVGRMGGSRRLAICADLIGVFRGRFRGNPDHGGPRCGEGRRSEEEGFPEEGGGEEGREEVGALPLTAEDS